MIILSDIDNRMKIAENNYSIKIDIQEYLHEIRLEIFGGYLNKFPVWSSEYTWLMVYNKLVFDSI